MSNTPGPRLASALAGETPSDWPEGVLRVQHRELGVLAVPTGRLVACDPLVDIMPAFTRRAPAGRFPVQLLIAHLEGPDERVAAAVLRFSEAVPDRWEAAFTPGQDPSTLGPDEFFGYGVDSGTGGFLDAAAAEAIDQLASDEEAFVELITTLQERLAAADRATWSWVLLDLDGDGTAELAVFSSGWGDGAYASYWGWSGDELACLATDFRVLD